MMKTSLDRSGYPGLPDPSLSEIVRQLDASPHHELRHVSVDVVGDQVVIQGTVCSYYMKQMAQETVRQACPRRRVLNELTVR